MTLKTYRVKVTSRYLDGTQEEEFIMVKAYSIEHAEEKAFELCGGSWGHCHGVTFKAERANG